MVPAHHQMHIFVYAAEAEEKLKALAANSEKPENHLMSALQAATALDEEKYKARFTVLEPLTNHEYRVLVIYTITHGYKINSISGIELPIKARHVSISVNDGREKPPALLL